MKTMTCRQLGGACDKEFHAVTFEERASKSKEHGMEMTRKGDEAHRRTMRDMQAQMASPEAMAKWLEAKRMEFEALPDRE